MLAHKNMTKWWSFQSNLNPSPIIGFTDKVYYVHVYVTGITYSLNGQACFLAVLNIMRQFIILIYIFTGGLNIDTGTMADPHFNIDSRSFILETGHS